jgi:hypothetical protein
VALESSRLATETRAANDGEERLRGEARQRIANKSAAAMLEQLFQKQPDDGPLKRAQRAAPALAQALATLPEKSKLKTTIGHSARVAHFLHERFESADLKKTIDLRAPWFRVRDQGSIAGCVGFAVADLLQLQSNERLSLPSARFIWQAAKELDGETMPTTMIAGAGTSLRAGLEVVQKYGFALESELPSDGNALYNGSLSAFYSLIGTRHAERFINLGNDIKNRLAWLSLGRPIVCAVQVGRNFLNAAGPDVVIDPDDPRSGDCFSHAVVIVGYRFKPESKKLPDKQPLQVTIADLDRRDTKSKPNQPEDRPYDELPIQYLIRNNAGPKWGDQGYAWVRHVDFFRLFLEEYGVFYRKGELARTSLPWATAEKYARPPARRNGKREAPAAV